MDEVIDDTVYRFEDHPDNEALISDLFDEGPEAVADYCRSEFCDKVTVLKEEPGFLLHGVFYDYEDMAQHIRVELLKEGQEAA